MRLEGICLGLSGICILHCIAIPLIAFTFPTSGGLLIASENVFHWILLCLAIPISGFAFWYSSQRHQATGTLILGSIGLLIMFVGASHLFGHEYEIALTVTGVIAVSIAHMKNLRRAHVRNSE